jgi:hypothetical protein
MPSLKFVVLASCSNVPDVEAKVYSALCQLGFRAGQVRMVMTELRQREELAAAAPQQWLREGCSACVPRVRPTSDRPRWRSN